MPSCSRIHAAFATYAVLGMLLASLCVLPSAHGAANRGLEVTDPAYFLPLRMDFGADLASSIKPSRAQTLEADEIASVIPHWLSPEPLGESESLNLYAYCQNDPVNHVDVLGMFKTQVQADEFRTRMLLAQIIEDPTRIPTEPSKEISNGDFFPYLPNVEEFGVFKPYTQADYDRAEVEIEKITTANMSGGSIYPISEQQANDMAWASAGGEWNPSATAALTLGAANTQFNANINSGFLLPVGGAGFALKGLQGTRALTALNTAAPLLKNASLGNFTYHASVRTLNSGGYQAIYGRLQTMRASPYDPRLQRSLYDDAVSTTVPPMSSKSTTCNPVTGPGPLGADIAKTFRSATYTERVLDEPLTLYRVYGGKSGQLGPYWTTIKPAGGLQSQLDSALLTEWGNATTKTATIRVPRGTTIFEGAAAPQTGAVKTFENLMGGGNQVYIPRVDPNWLIK